MLARFGAVFKQWRRERRFRLLVAASASAWRQWKNLKHALRAPLAIYELRDLRTPSSIDELVSLSFRGFGGILNPIQNEGEIAGLLRTLEKERPHRVMEIGTANGGTLFLLCRTACPDARIISIDLPGGWFGGGYPAWKKRLYRRFAIPSQELHLLREDSHAATTLQKVRRILDGGQLDLLFLDGDHTYPGVKRDFETYSPLVRKGGIIAFHDIMMNRFDPDCQVDRFWQEVKGLHKSRELVDDLEQAGKGIGLIWL